MKFYISEINTNLLKTIGGRQGELIELILSGEYPDGKVLATPVLFRKRQF